MPNPSDFADLVRYRLAFGHASDAVRQLHQGERPAVLSATAKARLLAEVCAAHGLDPADPVVVEAVDDAVAGRRPKW